MVDNSARLVVVGKSGDFCTVSDVDVFQIGEMVFIEITDNRKKVLPVYGGAAAGGEDLSGGGIVMAFFSFAKGVSPA